MRLVGLGLDPSDSCYDANRPWYVPNWWIDSAECQCIADQGRPLGEQCASFRGVAQTMGTQAGDVVGGVVGGVAQGVGTGIGTGVEQTFNTGGLTGTLVIAAVAVGALLLLKK